MKIYLRVKIAAFFTCLERWHFRHKAHTITVMLLLSNRLNLPLHWKHILKWFKWIKNKTKRSNTDMIIIWFFSIYHKTAQKIMTQIACSILQLLQLLHPLWQNCIPTKSLTTSTQKQTQSRFWIHLQLPPNISAVRHMTMIQCPLISYFRQ